MLVINKQKHDSTSNMHFVNAPIASIGNVKQVNVMQVNVMQVNVMQVNVKQVNVKQVNVIQVNVMQVNVKQVNVMQVNVKQVNVKLGLTKHAPQSKITISSIFNNHYQLS